MSIALQKRLDDLAARAQLYYKWGLLLSQTRDPEKAEKLQADINKYIEPQKLQSEITKFFLSLSEYTKRSYGAKDISTLLSTHRPGMKPPSMIQGIGAIGTILVLSGIALALVLGGGGWGLGQVIYNYKVGDAKKILAKENPWAFAGTTVGGAIVTVGLILGGIFLLTRRKRRSA